MPFVLRHPLKIRRTTAGFAIEDAARRRLIYIYCRSTASQARVAGELPFDEGEELAKLVARALSKGPRLKEDRSEDSP